MRIIGLDGKDYVLKFAKYHNKQRKNISGLHRVAREILTELYPNHNIYEEVILLGSKTGGVSSRNLSADFFIPSLLMIVEAHGQQHYEFSPHYHANRLQFAKAKSRDRIKQHWCEINNIQYIELPYDESREQWRARIESGRSG